MTSTVSINTISHLLFKKQTQLGGNRLTGETARVADRICHKAFICDKLIILKCHFFIALLENQGFKALTLLAQWDYAIKNEGKFYFD